ncbi:MAG: hypothetical protein SCK70_03715 [bacterium]|nr:hypothetical protein [bacterium]
MKEKKLYADMNKILTLLIIIFIIFQLGYAGEDFFLSYSSIKAKPIAMGGAYSAVEDNFVSATYNPASLSLYETEKSFRITLFLNPIAPLISFYEQHKTPSAGPVQTNENQHYLKNAATFFKGLVITTKFLDIGFIFNEQTIDSAKLVEQKQVFEQPAIWSNCYHSAIIRLKLADRVSLGVSASLFYDGTDEELSHDYGFGYGLLIKPTQKLNVGMTYNYMPQLMSDIRMPLERLVDQTINIGLAFFPFRGATLSFDLRNVTEEKGKSVVEAHFGFEQQLFSMIALRCGYFKERFVPNHTYSMGIGLVDSNFLFSKENKLIQPQFWFNYALALQRHANQTSCWHVISFNIRL